MPEELIKIKLDYFWSRVDKQTKLQEDNKTEIWLAHHKPTNRPCILRICKDRDLSAIYEVLANIKQENTAVVYEYYYIGSDTYILEEYIAGKNVQQQIDANGCFSDKNTARIIIGVCRALDQLHRRKPPIVHNDIKPSNIMLRDDGSVKLFDFDISRIYKEDATHNTTLLGTQGFASPEHYGSLQTSPRSDIFSLGVTMHYMLTGKFPIVKHDQYQAICKGPLKKIIQKCIQVDPHKRYSSVRALEKALTRVLHRGKRALTGTLTVLCLAAIVAATIILLPPSIESGDSPDSQTAPSQSVTDRPSADTSPTENGKQDTIDTPADESDQNAPDDVKTQTLVTKLDGSLLSMTAMNDGTIVYLEEDNDCYHIKTSSGVDTMFNCTYEPFLMHDPYTDTLYVIGTDLSESGIVAVDESFRVGDEILYIADGFSDPSMTYAFFADGTLYCSKYYDNLIDTKQWFALGATQRTPAAVIGNVMYMFDSFAVKSFATDGSIIDEYEPPCTISYSPLHYATENQLYFFGMDGDKDLIYRFDGKDFEEVVCLNDYAHYSRTTFSEMCVTDDVIWLYEQNTGIIKEFKI